MYKKTIAILALIGFIALFAPGLSSAEKKASRFDFRSVIKKPAAWISSVWSWIAPVFDPGSVTVNKTTTPSPLKAKPTGGLPAPRLGGGD